MNAKSEREQLNNLVARRIAECRRRSSSFTQGDVAKELGLSTSQYHRYEAGTSIVPAWLLLKVAEICEVAPEKFLSDTGIENDRELEQARGQLIEFLGSDKGAIDAVNTIFRVLETRRNGS